jgi:hypothetical protein
LKGSDRKTDSDKKAKAKLNYIKNNFEKNLDKYEAQEAIFKRGILTARRMKTPLL